MEDFHKACRVTYQIDDLIKPDMHLGEWSKAFNPLKFFQRVLSVIVCMPSTNKTLKIIQWAFIFQRNFLVDSESGDRLLYIKHQHLFFILLQLFSMILFSQ